MATHDMDMNEYLRDNGKIFEVSPYVFMWNDERYYVVGLEYGDTQVKPFRISKMRDVELKQVPAQAAPADFELSSYSNRVFDMFSGDVTDVLLSCKDYTIDSLMEQFGKNFQTQRTGPDRFTARVRVDASSSFYAWLFGFGGDISIVEPAWVRDEFNAMIDKQHR